MDASPTLHSNLSFSAMPPPILPLSPDPNDPTQHVSLSDVLSHHPDLRMQPMGAHPLISPPRQDGLPVAHEGPPSVQHLPSSSNVSQTPIERAPAPGMIPDFPTMQNGMYAVPVSSSMEHSSSLGSSPSSILASAGLSSLGGSSSMMHGGFSTVGASPLSSTISPTGQMNGSSSDSSTPPIAVGCPELGYSSTSSGTPASQSDSGFHFQPASFDATPAMSPPELSPPTVQNVFDQLSEIVHVATAARSFVAQGDLGETPRGIMEQLKMITEHLFSSLNLASDTMPAAMAPELSVPPTSPPVPPPPTSMAPQLMPFSEYAALVHSAEMLPMPQLISSMQMTQSPPILGSASGPPMPLAMPTAPMMSAGPAAPAISDSPMHHLEVADGSRKRCGSNVTDERVLKAIKLEPVPDAVLLSSSGSSATTPVRKQSPPDRIATLGSAASPDTAVPSFAMLPVSDMSVDPGFSHLSHTLAHSPAIMEPQIDNLGRRYTWSERPSGLHHRHTLSGGALSNALPPAAAVPIAQPIVPPMPSPGVPPPFTAAGSFGPPPVSQLSTVHEPSRPSVTRSTRSLSMSHPNSMSSLALKLDPNASASSPMDTSSGSHPLSQEDSPPYSDGEDEEEDEPPSPNEYSFTRGRDESRASRPSTSACPSRRASRGGAESVISDIPSEYRKDIDAIFFAFLAKLCSNLNATDPKGDIIHQTLMAKKMQRLEESADFRPFKFRIQAFTNAFLHELNCNGYTEEVLPTKKVRHYLWAQPYISRYNEEGKKAKSKGNHIWSITAKKQTDGAWDFRPFCRRLSGQPPSVAYVGLKWSYSPRIWDPQSMPPNGQAHFSSPSLPSWLVWKEDVLSGVPTADAEDCEVIIEALFVQDDQEETLTQNIHIHVAPTTHIEGSVSHSRRPSLSSLAGDMDPRRTASDPVTSQPPSRRLSRASSGLLRQPQVSANQHDAQVVQVLQVAADRVAGELQGAVIPRAPISDQQNTMIVTQQVNALVKQQHVLQTTAQAVGQVNGGVVINPIPMSSAKMIMADAAKKMVMQAAHVAEVQKTVVTEDQKSAGLIPRDSISAPVTVNEVSVTAQDAVAQAVQITGPGASEATVLDTARNILQRREQAIVYLPAETTRSQPPNHAFSPGAMSAPPVPFPSSSIGLQHGSHPGFVAIS